MKALIDTFKLRNGVEIPCVGFGTRQTPDGDTAVMSVKNSYGHIDAAAVYENETGVGAGIKESGADRSSLFVTSKVWNEDRGYEKTMAAFEKTISDLQMDYLDTWRALTELYHAGKVRAIGVPNFMLHHL